MPKVVCSGRLDGAMTELPLQTGVGPSAREAYAEHPIWRKQRQEVVNTSGRD
jgi:hypothetical protein